MFIEKSSLKMLNSSSILDLNDQFLEAASKKEKRKLKKLLLKGFKNKLFQITFIPLYLISYRIINNNSTTNIE